MNGDREEDIGAALGAFLGSKETVPREIIPIARGGSQRLFYRICFTDRESVIFMHYSNDRRENTYYVAQAAFLQDIGIAVPRIFYHNPGRGCLLMEDLGEKDLWHFRHAPWATRREYYQKTLTMAGKLHAFRREDSSRTEPPLMEPFSLDLYRWEQTYFLENFVCGVCHLELEPSEAGMLHQELNHLAGELAAMPLSLIHRDLQSQNVMMRDGEPVFIDFQGMRYGNPFYDLGSLLYDPYVSFTEEEREELIDYSRQSSPTGYGPYDFRKMVKKASLQRLMQALGAYGFLGIKGNHREFLAHISSGIINLIAVTDSEPHYAVLGNLAHRCSKVIENNRQL